jgi:hypothetical protein
MPFAKKRPIASHLALVMSALCAGVPPNGDIQREVFREHDQSLVLPEAVSHERCIGRCRLPGELGDDVIARETSLGLGCIDLAICNEATPTPAAVGGRHCKTADMRVVKTR